MLFFLENALGTVVPCSESRGEKNCRGGGRGGGGRGGRVIDSRVALESASPPVPGVGNLFIFAREQHSHRCSYCNNLGDLLEDRKRMSVIGATALLAPRLQVREHSVGAVTPNTYIRVCYCARAVVARVSHQCYTRDLSLLMIQRKVTGGQRLPETYSPLDISISALR